MINVPTIGSYGIAQVHEWPRDTKVGGDRRPVFARCTCGAIIPIDYTACLDCNPDRQIVSIGRHDESLLTGRI